MQSVVSRSKEKCLFDVQVGGGNRPVIATCINYITLTIQCSCSPVTCTVNLIHSGHHWACPTCPYGQITRLPLWTVEIQGIQRYPLSTCAVFTVWLTWWLTDRCSCDWLTVELVINWQLNQWLIDICTSDWLTDVPVIDWHMYQWLIDRCTSTTSQPFSTMSAVSWSGAIAALGSSPSGMALPSPSSSSSWLFMNGAAMNRWRLSQTWNMVMVTLGHS